MECYVCRSPLKGNTDCCQICEFPVFFPVSKVTKKKEKPIKLAAERYLTEKIKNVRIYLQFYHYLVDDGEPVLESVERILLNDGKKLSFDEIVWADMDFKCIDGRDSIVLNIQVENGENPVIEYQAAIPNPQVGTDWMIGIKLCKGLTICFVMGNKRKYSVSGEYRLL